MKITSHTRTNQILPLLNEDNIKDVLGQVEAFQLETPILGLTVGEFGELIMDDTAYLEKLVKNNPKALMFLGRLKQFRKEMDNLLAFLKKFDIPQSQEEKAASNGILFPNLPQRMLLDCASFFHLHSFEEAEKCKVSEWVLIFQNDASMAQYQRNFQKLMEQKYRTKKK